MSDEMLMIGSRADQHYCPIVEKLGFNSFVMKVYQATASAPVNIACIK